MKNLSVILLTLLLITTATASTQTFNLVEDSQIQLEQEIQVNTETLTFENGITNWTGDTQHFTLNDPVSPNITEETATLKSGSELHKVSYGINAYDNLNLNYTTDVHGRIFTGWELRSKIRLYDDSNNSLGYIEFRRDDSRTVGTDESKVIFEGNTTYLLKNNRPGGINNIDIQADFKKDTANITLAGNTTSIGFKDTPDTGISKIQIATGNSQTYISVDDLTTRNGNLTNASLLTNSTGSFEKKPVYGTYNASGNKDTASFNWTNQEEIIDSERTIGWKIQYNTTKDNTIVTDTNTIELVEKPIIYNTRVENSEYGEVATLEVDALDIVGRGDIDNVVFKVSRPDGEEYTVEATRGERIRQIGYDGSRFTTGFAATQEPGLYQIKVIVSDDTASTNKTFTADFTEPTVDEPVNTSLNPANIGGIQIGQAFTNIRSSQITLLLAGLLGIGVFVVVIAIIGRNYEEEEYTQPKTTQ